MGIRFTYIRAFFERRAVILLCSLIQVSRASTALARPFPALKLLVAIAAIPLLSSLPANALISPTAPVGATPGSFAVSPSGAATYTIPIVVPPGTNGMEPNLSLVYNSQAGNGLLGMGWSLAGLSVIHRCGATIEIDGFKGGVNYDANDRFCLDGKRLIHLGNNHYRTHRESLQKIEAIEGTATNPASFTVRDHSGTVREYAVAIEAAGNSSIRRLWALSKVIDLSGNYLAIAYDKTDVAAHGDYRPSTITYTANNNAGVAAYNSIVFGYINRSDVVPLYEGGSVVKTLKLLDRITSYAENTKVREYLLNYEADGQPEGAFRRARLKSIQECGTDRICLPSTTVEWQSGASIFESRLTQPELLPNEWFSSEFPGRVMMLDVNGDGKDDLVAMGTGVTYVALSNGSGFNQKIQTGQTLANDWFSTEYPGRVHVMDVDGDGRQDVVATGSGVTYIAFSNGSGFHLTTHPEFLPNSWFPTSFLGRVMAIDVNGDGRDDLVAMGTGVTYVALSNGSGFNQKIQTGQTLANDWFSTQYPGRVHIMDVNGDGLKDIVATGSGVTYVALSNGSGFDVTAHPEFLPNEWFTSSYPGRVMVMDVNGDGKDDLVAMGTGVTYVALSNGVGFEPKVQSGQTLANDWFFTQYPGRVHIMDVNGDGRQDVVATGSGVTYVALSNGTGFNLIAYPEFLPNDWFATNFIGRVRAMDINGDGKKDLVATGSGVTYVSRAAGLTPDLLVSITDGLGVRTSVNYKPLTDGSVYSKDTVLPYVWGYPYQEIQSPIYVVSSVSTSNGIGGNNTTRYQYGGLKRHHEADTSLGFRWIRMTDPAGLVHLTYHNQNRLQGIDGTMAATETYASNVRIKRIANTWASAGVTCGGTAGTSQPQLKAVYEETRELNNTVITQVNTTNEYDPCGFPASTVVNFNDGWRKTVTNTYGHNTTNWILGLVTRTDVTGEAPGFLPETRSATFAYNTKGLLTTEVVEPGDAALSLTTSYTYDAFGNRTSKTVSGAGVTARTDSQAFDPQGRFPITKTNALGHVTTFDYDPRNGQPTRMTDPNGLITTWDYDGFGRKGLEVRPDGTRSTITYSAITGGYATLVESAGAAPIETRFDILGREIERGTIGFGGRWIYRRIQYDALGRVSFKSHPEFNAPSPHGVTYGYDVLGRVTSVTTAGPGIRTTTTSYNGLTTTVTNPLSQVTTTVKNSQGKAVQVTDAVGSTLYQYDPFGNLTQVTDAAGNITRMEYDARGRKTVMHEPNMGRWTYSYNALNELTSQTDAKGQTVTLSYDPLGRLKTRASPEGTSTWTYDTAAKGVGKPASLAGPNGYQEQYVYDAVSRPAQVVTAIGGTQYIVGRSYDSAGRLETITYPGTGYQVKQIHDAYGHLHQVNRLHPNGAETLVWLADDADAWNRITRELFGNAAIGQRFYDVATTDLTAIKTGTGGTNNTENLQNLAYSFDAIGNLKTRGDVITGLNETFSYDGVNRLIQATGAVTKTYQYNAIGNITFKSDVGTYSYPVSGASSVRPHAVTAVSGTVTATYTYDANGNMIGGGGRSMLYTSFNKPASISANGQTTSFAYDPNHNRIQKVSGDKTTVYIGKLYERVTSGTLVEHKHYIYGSGNLVAIHTSRNNNTADNKYIHTDHLGSVNVITNDSGQVVERLSFDPHGKRRQTNGQDATVTITSSITRGFTKHEHDDDVGLINMNARLYDPLLGRFISPDTVVDGPAGQGLNRYSYVRNNPLSLADPTGQWSLRRAFKRLKKKVARITRRVLEKVGGIKYVGGLMNIGIMTNNSFGAAYGWSTGDWKSVGQAHMQGALIAGTTWLGGQFGPYGRMIGSGVNGWAQTGNSEGFLRGFVSGAIPQDLWFSDAYRDSALANIGIGIVRDGLRGYVVGGRDGIKEGIKYGQFTNLFGHAWGFVSSGFSASGFSGPEFRDGAFFYRGSTNPFYGAITFGNVVTDATPNRALYHNTLYTDYEKWLNGHEMAHALSQAPALGAAYIPAHIMSQWIGGGFGLPFLEYAPFHPLPYNSAPPVRYSAPFDYVG